MFSNSENFALIKSSSAELIPIIRQIFDEYQIDYLIEEKEKEQLRKEILAVKESKGNCNRFIIWEPGNLKNWIVFYSNCNDGIPLFIIWRAKKNPLVFI